jgi:hypothetical protein
MNIAPANINVTLANIFNSVSFSILTPEFLRFC